MPILISLYLLVCTIFVPMAVTPISEYHRCPKAISNEVEQALSFFPELSQTPITFKYTDKSGSSVMLAQPVFKTLFRAKSKREYIILIRKKFTIGETEFDSSQIPSDVLIGWLGHELGHIMDYRNRSSANLVYFGLRYLALDKHIKNAERTADEMAVNRGMANYIIGTKEFILNHAELSENYKDKIRKYYLSPEQIMELVRKDSVL